MRNRKRGTEKKNCATTYTVGLWVEYTRDSAMNWMHNMFSSLLYKSSYWPWHAYDECSQIKHKRAY